MRGVLDEIRVVELAEGTYGGYCGKLFADLGADVVKVERPAGDPLRHEPFGPEAPDGTRRGGSVLHLMTNKRSAVLDPDDPASREVLWQLLDRADLVIETPGHGDLAAYGITWDEVHARVPSLTVACLSGFGATGPYAGYQSSDLVIQAVSGTVLPQGDPRTDPLKVPGRLGSCFVGQAAALGALAAVQAAQAGAPGRFVDCAATEALATQPSKACYLLALAYHRGNLELPPPGGLTLFPTGVYPCGDGYVAMMSTPQQLRQMLDTLDDDDLRAAFAHPDAMNRGETREAIDAALYPWLLSHTRAEITAAAQAVGWPLAGVNEPHEVLEAAHLHQRRFWHHTDDPVAGPIDLPGHPTRYAEGGFAIRRVAPLLGQHTDEVVAEVAGRAPERPAPDPALDPSATPLAGVKVVDLTVVWSGPYATMLLADLGAEVIRVENPFVLPPTTKGYQARPTIMDAGSLGNLYGPPDPDAPERRDRPWNRHAMNNSLARNKRSVTIDTRRDEGRELLYRLVEQADVFIDNFKANGLEHIGVSIDELRKRNPRLVIVRLPPTGTNGEWAHYKGFGAQFDGLSGLAWLAGHRGSDPITTPATTYMDAASGPAAAFATIAALRYRDRTGRGQVVEMVQCENVIGHLGDILVDVELGHEPTRLGNRDRVHAPQGFYACRGDRTWLAVSVTDDDMWAALAKVIGRPELADDPRYRDATGRRAAHDELDELVAGWLVDQDRDEAFRALQGAGVAAGPLLAVEEWVADPQVLARGWMRPLSSLDVGTHDHGGLAWAGLPQSWDRGSPVLGEDNEDIYRTYLGATTGDLERYATEKMLADDYLDKDGNPF